MKKFDPVSMDKDLSDDTAEQESADGSDQSTRQFPFQALYEQYSGTLIGYLRKAFGDGPPDPEDVAQETFRKLAAQQDLSEIKNLPAFLWRTARNLVLNELRRNNVRCRYDFEIEQLFFAIEGPEKSPERVLEIRQQLDIINNALEAMPERRRRAFIYVRVDGLTFAAAAGKLGISPRAIVKHVSRAMSDIQMALKTFGGNDL